MFRRINRWCREIWERNQRFKTAFLGSWGIFLVTLGLTVLGKGEQWMRWTAASQGILAGQLVMLFSVPWRLYNERYGRTGPRREAVNFLLFLLLWRSLEQLPSFNDYLFMGLCGTAALSAALTLFFCDDPDGRKGLFPAFLLALGKSLLLGGLVLILLGLTLSGIKMLLYPLLSLEWLWLSCILSLAAAWQVLLVQIPRQDEPLALPGWYPSLCRNLLLPAAVFLLAILYVYLGKSLLAGALPVGVMNPYGSCALAFYALFYFSYPEQELPWVRKVLKWGALLLVPVAAAQLWGVWIRLEAYGLTSLRYLSLCCTCVGLSVLIWGITKQKPRKLYLLCGILSGILAFTPPEPGGSARLVPVPAPGRSHHPEPPAPRGEFGQCQRDPTRRRGKDPQQLCVPGPFCRPVAVSFGGADQGLSVPGHPAAAAQRKKPCRFPVFQLPPGTDDTAGQRLFPGGDPERSGHPTEPPACFRKREYWVRSAHRPWVPADAAGKISLRGTDRGKRPPVPAGRREAAALYPAAGDR